MDDRSDPPQVSKVAEATEPLQSKKTRTRSGCLNCRRRRRKCDELRPRCLNCRQREEECDWGVKVIFKSDNASHIDAEHPSMLEGSRKRARHFKIVDVTSKIERGYKVHSPAEQKTAEETQGSVLLSHESPQADGDNVYADSLHPRPRALSHASQGYSQGPPTWMAYSPSLDTPNSLSMTYSDGTSYRADEDQYTNMDTSPGSHASHSHTINTHHSNHSETNHISPHSVSRLTQMSVQDQNHSAMNPEDAAADLLALRYLPSQNHQHVPLNTIDEQQMGMLPPMTPDVIDNRVLEHNMFDDEDGIFLPGSAYQELHSTLRDHLIYTARSNVPTRHGTPEPQQPDMSFFDKQASRTNFDRIPDNTDQGLESGRSSKTPEITPAREYVLWKVWIDEIAPWLDKFDNQRHFEHKIPKLAKTTPHLKNSMLALCARQIERRRNEDSYSESLALYQEAIHLLLPELQTKGTAVIASCVILCVLEMMSCSPKGWRRHLEGCANLLEAVGIHGFSGGVEAALFWCFARMDLWGALISQDVTLIPVSRWASNVNFHADLRLFRNPANGFDTYANYAVFLCAHCVTYKKAHNDRVRGDDSRTWVERWTELIDTLDEWYNQRPEEMKPIMTIPSAEGDGHSPFPTVLYGNGPAVSGNQLYHTATLLMLQEKPSGLKVFRKQKSVFWHARQICAISQSNTHHGAWTNSIQPIWFAGKVMSHPSEHRAILNILERIERETGWATGWRRDDLKECWGDLDS